MHVEQKLWRDVFDIKKTSAFTKGKYQWVNVVIEQLA